MTRPRSNSFDYTAADILRAAFTMRLTPEHLAVFLYIVRRMEGNGIAWPGRQNIATACRIRPDTVSAAVAHLVALQMITSERRFNDSNIYRLVSPENWRRKEKKP